MYQSKNWFSTDGAIKTVEIAPVNPAYVINAEKIMQRIVGKIVLLLVFGLLPLASGYAQDNSLDKTIWQCKIEAPGTWENILNLLTLQGWKSEATMTLHFRGPNALSKIIGIGSMSLGNKWGHKNSLYLVSYEYNPPNITLLFDRNQQELQLHGTINGNELHIDKVATLEGKKTEYYKYDLVFTKQEGVYLYGTKWQWANKVGAKQTIAFDLYDIDLNADRSIMNRIHTKVDTNIRAYEYEHPNITVFGKEGITVFDENGVSLEGTINGNELTFKGNDRVYVLQTEDVTSKFSKEIPNNLNGTEWEGGLDWIIRFKTPTHLEIKMGLFNTRAYAYSYEKPHVTYYVSDGFGGQQSYILEVKGNTMTGYVPGENTFSALFNRIK